MEVRDDISVKEYFQEIVPQIFQDALGGVTITGMEGTTFSVQFDIVDGQTQTYSLVIKDAKDLEVVEGPVENPTLRLELSEDLWRGAVTGKIEGLLDNFTDMGQLANRSRYDKIVETKGTLGLELTMEDGSETKLKVVFNGADKPAVSFRIAAEDWIKLSRGEVAGPTLFMSGKLKIDGDMPFAMSLSNLMT